MSTQRNDFRRANNFGRCLATRKAGIIWVAVLRRRISRSLSKTNLPGDLMSPKQRDATSNLNSSRRGFLRTAAAVAAVTVVPGRVLGLDNQTAAQRETEYRRRRRGRHGRHTTCEACTAENIVALCDVDAGLRRQDHRGYPKAAVYKDFREMLDKQKDIDAVIVATPDHTHAVVGLAAIERGKHVYMQKPLSHSVYEARLLTEAARKHKVATQMGNQGHSGDGTRLICEWIWDGAIGAVREVHAWTNRPVWPQGIEVDRPKETPPVPASLDWDLWIGPAAMRPYHPTYHAGQLAGVVGFRHRLAGRLGLPHPRRAVLGVEAEVSHERRRLHLDLLGTTSGSLARPRTRTIPRSTIVRLQVSRAGRHARGEADLVGRRHDAAAAGRTGAGPADGRLRRRRAVRRRQGYR